MTEKDVKKLEYILKSIKEGNACTLDKNNCILALESIIEPKCCVCRKIIDEGLIVVNERKMHERCRSRYKG